jgi:hypothetical protein
MSSCVAVPMGGCHLNGKLGVEPGPTGISNISHD